MKKFILIALVAFFLFGCGNETTSEPPLPEYAKYTISEDTPKRDIKRSVVVILENKVNKEILSQIAQKIKNSDPAKYQRTFIGYYLKAQDKSNGYWATTHFEPDLKVIMYGLSKDDEEILSKPVASTPNKDVVGVWLDDRSHIGSRMTLYYDKEKNLFLENTYSNGSSNTKDMVDLALENERRIENKGGNDFGEYLVINKAGQLEFWSKNGNYYTAKIIK
jgi:hypothetical protein